MVKTGELVYPSACRTYQSLYCVASELLNQEKLTEPLPCPVRWALATAEQAQSGAIGMTGSEPNREGRNAARKMIDFSIAQIV